MGNCRTRLTLTKSHAKRGFLYGQFCLKQDHSMTILMNAPHAAVYRSCVDKLALLAFLSDLLTAG